MHCYQCMSVKQLKTKEIKYFKSILDDYKKVVDNKHGCVLENKKLGFNKSAVKIHQLSLF